MTMADDKTPRCNHCKMLLVHAFGVVFHPGLQVDPVRPDIHVSPRRQVTFLPAVVLVLPLSRQSGNHRRRQVRRILAQKRRQRLLEITSLDAAQVKHWQQRIQALRPPSPSRQDRRGKAYTVACAGSPAVPDLYPADLNRPDPRLDRALGTMTMSDKTVATARNTSASISTACASNCRAPDRRSIRQGIVNLVRQTKTDNIAAWQRELSEYLVRFARLYRDCRPIDRARRASV